MLFIQIAKCQAIFDLLKLAFTLYLVLAQQDPNLDTIVETNYSREATSGCLLQRGIDRVLQLVAYFSQKLQLVERNYIIYNKELLIVISYLRIQLAKLQSITRLFIILTNYKAFKYFTTLKIILEQQAYQAETLTLFNYTLRYQLGS